MAYEMKGFPYPGTSPIKGRLGRWLMGRKKHIADDGTEVITDKHGNVVKTKRVYGEKGNKKVVKNKYKKGDRPSSYESTVASRIQSKDSMFDSSREMGSDESYGL